MIKPKIKTCKPGYLKKGNRCVKGGGLTIKLSAEEVNYNMEAVDRLRKVTGKNIGDRILKKLTKGEGSKGLRQAYGLT